MTGWDFSAIVDQFVKRILRIDDITPEERMRDGIRKQCEDFRNSKIRVRSTVYPDNWKR